MIYFLMVFFYIGVITSMFFVIVSIKDKNLVLFVIWILVFAFMTICIVQSNILMIDYENYS